MLKNTTTSTPTPSSTELAQALCAAADHLFGGAYIHNRHATKRGSVVITLSNASLSDVPPRHLYIAHEQGRYFVSDRDGQSENTTLTRALFASDALEPLTVEPLREVA